MILVITSIFFLSMEYGNEVIHQLHLDIDEEGPAIDLHFSDTGNTSPMLVYGTAFGSIIGWDLRQGAPKSRLQGCSAGTPAFKLENNLRDGVQTAMAISPDQVRFWAPS